MKSPVIKFAVFVILCQSTCVTALVDQMTQNVLQDFITNIPGLLEMENPWNASDLANACNGAYGVLCSLPDRISGFNFGLQSSLNGTIPASICNLPNLTSVIFSNTGLRLPSNMTACSNLKNVQMDNVGYTEFPTTAICSLTALEQLFLSENNFNTEIPGCIGRLTRLTTLNLHSNHLFGPIPSDFSTLVNLQSIDLGDNFLNGAVPTFFCSFPSFYWLDIGPNSFTGNLPPCISTNMTGLIYLDVSCRPDSSARLTGSLTPFYNPGAMRKLILQNQGFDSFFMEWVGGLQNLIMLKLGGIDLSIVPSSTLASIGNLTNLQELNLSNCGLSGTIPASYKRLSFLAALDLSRNRLESPLPDFNGFAFLDVLNLSYNRFNLTIQSDVFINKTRVSEVDFSNNNFSGPIPRHLSQIWIAKLNLSNNSLAGCIETPISSECNAVGNVGLCGCTEPTCGISECTDSCPGSRPTVSALCSNGTWNITQPVEEITIVTTFRIVGSLRIATNTSRTTISIPWSSFVLNSSVPILQIDGCVTFNGALDLLLPSNYSRRIPVLLASFNSGYCSNESDSMFSSVTATVADTAGPPCRSRAEVEMIYRPTSLLAVFGDIIDTCDSNPDASGVPSSAEILPTSSLALIAGGIAAGVALFVIVLITVMFICRRRIIPSLKLGNHLRGMRRLSASHLGKQP